MGQIKEIIKKLEVSNSPPYNERLTVELCENVHLHIGNLRLEFPRDEFIKIAKVIKGIDLDKVERFIYSKDNFVSLFEGQVLDKSREFNTRLQVEEQVNGQVHIHYRNLRIELDGKDYDRIK